MIKEKEYYSKFGISNSSFNLILPDKGGSFKKFKHYIIDGNSSELPVSPSLENGKLIHSYVELKDNIIVSEVIAPTEKLAELVETLFDRIKHDDFIDEESIKTTLYSISQEKNLYKSYKEDTLWNLFQTQGRSYFNYLKENSDPNTICLTTGQKNILDNCIEAIKNNRTMHSLLFEKTENDELYSEYELFWEEGILSCKGMIDKLKINHTRKIIYIIDFKTTSKPVNKYQESLDYYETYRQLAFYFKGFSTLNPQFANYEFRLVICVQEINQLFENKVIVLDTEYFRKGVERVIEALNLIETGYSNNWKDSEVIALSPKEI